MMKAYIKIESKKANCYLEMTETDELPLYLSQLLTYYTNEGLQEFIEVSLENVIANCKAIKEAGK